MESRMEMLCRREGRIESKIECSIESRMECSTDGRMGQGGGTLDLLWSTIGVTRYMQTQQDLK